MRARQCIKFACASVCAHRTLTTAIISHPSPLLGRCGWEQFAAAQRGAGQGRCLLLPHLDNHEYPAHRYRNHVVQQWNPRKEVEPAEALRACEALQPHKPAAHTMQVHGHGRQAPT